MKTKLMRVLAPLAFAALIGSGAHAQLHIRAATTDPITGLDPAGWEEMVSHMLNGQALIGDAGVLIVSSLPEPITVTCDKWTLVGPDPYSSVRGNPAMIKPFSITYIKTRDFDGYCTHGVVGHAGIGRTYTGHLDAADGTFKRSTIILFSGAK